ncbi:hypothetical protein CUROG_10170 [Corynebacterium urogenitale]|uniref:HlyC/CorC family transporter n=1 Tax=Corynebacterium urogenitale TaxID=2487892 RepID=A0A5J6Z8T0_9CORY|nr:hemolysin family protein [Corynebacterium urogenitale]QFQ03366.1 hypothetical protein CUROG_10170 [Corynebacterium urogenitale]
MNGIVVTLATSALIVASAFFVIVEFSLLAARRNRLEQEAGESRSARAALRSLNELTVMLAGAQLGITVCTFALGAVTKPAVDHALGPQLQEWGIPAAIAGTVSFVFSLVFVTFLHLVVGEMAPKSWAIAHPERSAKLVSMPARGFIMLVKPLLQFVNVMANKLVKATGVEPVDRAAVGGRDIDTIRALVEQSANAGALAPEFETQISGVAELQHMTVAEIAGAARPQATVSEGATAGEVRAVSQKTGYKRILVAGAAGDVSGSDRVGAVRVAGAADVTGASDAAGGGNPVASSSGGNRTPAAPMGIVHVRDVLLADAEEQIGPHVREVMTITESTPVYEAFARMRERSEHIAVVIDENGAYSGVLSIKSILTKLLPVVEKRIPEESEQYRSPAVDREN